MKTAVKVNIRKDDYISLMDWLQQCNGEWEMFFKPQFGANHSSSFEKIEEPIAIVMFSDIHEAMVFKFYWG